MSTTFGLHRAKLFNHDGVATLFEDRVRTWGEIADRVARLAGALQELGVGRGDRAAILMLNQDRYLELYLAIAWAGAVVVPLNTRWSAAENRDCLADCRPKLLFVDGALAKVAEEVADAVDIVGLVYADDVREARPARAKDYEELVRCVAPIPGVEAAETELAGIFYTGGTTGRAKGVMLSHRNLLANARNSLFLLGQYSDMGTTQCYLHAAPMFHLADLSATQGALMVGSTHAFVRAFAPEALARGIERYRASRVLLVPTMIQMLVDQPGLGSFDLSSLIFITYGASPRGLRVSSIGFQNED
jgi:long-chain acyl-CoA synthetase